MVIDGKKIAEEIVAELKKKPVLKKYCAAIMAGENPASLSFIKQKEKVAKKLGVDFRLYTFPEKISHDVLREEVLKIAKYKTCGGVVVQLPLPTSIRRERVLDVLPPEKDVDVLGKRAYQLFLEGKNLIFPPAVGVVQKVLMTYDIRLTTATVAVVGLGFLVGKLISDWLRGKAKEIITIDIGDDLNQIREADLVISGVGKAGLIKPEMLKISAIMIDFGYSFLGEKISGDFDLSHESLVVSRKLTYTPTPGGTGPILVAQLFENFYILAEE